jgi:hypothetical protein
MADFDRVQGLPNEERDDNLIIHHFMRELCRRDDEHNRGENIDPKRPRNIFTVEEIQWRDLGGFSLERILLAARGHTLENRDNEPLELFYNETNVRLTNPGRARCHEYGL